MHPMIFFLFFCSAYAALEFSSLIVFGDSYSSSCGSEGYRNDGKCLNWSDFYHGASLNSSIIPTDASTFGRRWNYAQFMSGCFETPSQCEIPLYNFAFSGAIEAYPEGEIYDLGGSIGGQIRQFQNISSQINTTSSLVVVLAGVNDLILCLYSDPSSIVEVSTFAARDLIDGLEILKSTGIDAFLILQVPTHPIRESQRVLGVPDLKEVDQWNTIHKNALLEWDPRVMIFDTDAAIKRISRGHKNEMWWDNMHPTEFAHIGLSRELRIYLYSGSRWDFWLAVYGALIGVIGFIVFVMKGHLKVVLRDFRHMRAAIMDFKARRRVKGDEEEEVELLANEAL